MAESIRLPRRAPRHPRHIRGLRWSSPLADGLKALVTVQGGRPIEWVTGQPFTPVSGAGIRAYPGTQSQGTDTNGSSSYWRLDGSWTFNVTSTEGISLAARWTSDASQSDKRVVSFGSSTNTTPILSFDQENSTTKIEVFARPDDAAGPAVTTTDGGNTGDRTAVYTVDKHNYYDPSFTRPIVWVDRSKTVGGDYSNTDTWTLDRLSIGALLRSTAASFFDGSVSWMAAWDRTITPYELELCWGGLVSELTDQGSRTYFIPAAAGSGATVSPTAGSLTLTGATPSIALLINRSLTAGALTLTGEQPSVSKQFQKTPASASLTLTGAAPVVAFNITRTPAAAALTITGQQPGVLVETPGVTEVQPNAGVLTLTGESPAIALKIDRSPTAASLTLTGEQPSVAVESFKDVQPTAASLTLTGASPSIALKVNVSPSVATLSITGAEIGVSVPGLGRTTSAGSSKGRRRTQRGYPRRVVIDGVVYTVRSAEELRRLLAAQQERLQEELQALSPEAPAIKARSLKRQITVVQKKIDATERDYMQAILDDDDEVITVWAMLQ